MHNQVIFLSFQDGILELAVMEHSHVDVNWDDLKFEMSLQVIVTFCRHVFNFYTHPGLDQLMINVCFNVDHHLQNHSEHSTVEVYSMTISSILQLIVHSCHSSTSGLSLSRDFI